MPIPGSGPILMSDISTIIKSTSTAQISLNENFVRQLSGSTSGPISFLSFRNKPTAGSVTYNTPGTYTFLCPAYQALSIDVRGAGGGGGGGGTNFVFIWAGNAGSNGGESRFGSTTPVVAGGGFGGNGGCGGGPGGGNGTGSGGVDQGASGSAGGTGGTPNGGCSGQAGGIGNRQTKSWIFSSTTGFPLWGTSYTVIVGQGGAGGRVDNSLVQSVGGNGINGSVTISWS